MEVRDSTEGCLPPAEKAAYPASPEASRSESRALACRIACIRGTARPGQPPACCRVQGAAGGRRAHRPKASVMLGPTRSLGVPHRPLAGPTGNVPEASANRFGVHVPSCSARSQTLRGKCPGAFGLCRGRAAVRLRRDLNSLRPLPRAYTAHPARGDLLQPLRVKTETSNKRLFLMINRTHALPYRTYTTGNLENTEKH